MSTAHRQGADEYIAFQTDQLTLTAEEDTVLTQGNLGISIAPATAAATPILPHKAGSPVGTRSIIYNNDSSGVQIVDEDSNIIATSLAADEAMLSVLVEVDSSDTREWLGVLYKVLG